MSRQYNLFRKGPSKLDYTFKNFPRQADNRIIPGIIHGYTTISSSAGGVINASISMDPSSVSNTDWADFSVTYDEFRVLGVRLRLMSTSPNTTSANEGLVVICFDNDSSGALSTFTEGQQYSTAFIVPSIFQQTNGKMATYTWYRPTAGKETTIAWCDVATPSTSTGAVKFYSSGLTASTQYFSYAVELLCEFRGRR